MYPKKKISRYLCILIFTMPWVTSLHAEEKLIFAVDIIRHGDRTPLANMPKSPQHWPEGLGELTAEGMNQEYTLGTKLRKKYIEQYHLLPAHYLAETMNAQSTDASRTIMSAESFLLGLYPLGTGPLLTNQPALPGRFQPIPVYIAEKTPPYGFFSQLKLNHARHVAWKETIKKFNDKIAHWSNATGVNITDFSKLGLVADNLSVRKLHSLSMPNNLSNDDVKQIIALNQWRILSLYKSKTFTNPSGHQILKMITQYFKEASHNKTTLKYVLYSGHDSNIMAVMNTLDNPVDHLPPYASDLNFSLYKNENHFFVVITYNDKPIKISGCHAEHCTLDEFAALER